MEAPRYLQPNKVFLLLIGLWNLPRASVLYKLHRTIMISYFCLYLFRQIVQLYLIIGKDSNEAMKNAGVSMMSVITMSKALVCMSSGTKHMIKIIKITEDKITEMGKVECLEIYKYYTRYNKFILLLFYFCGFTTTAASIVSPTMEEHFSGSSEKRPLPISIWIPFDTQKHYHAAYFIQFIDSNFGCHFTVGADTFIISLMIYAVCQLKILNYIIRTSNFEDISQILNDHFLIIRYVKNLNNLLKTLMFLDFAMCSMHLAVLAFKVVVDNFSFNQFFNITFAMTMLFELFLFYWHGNEIIVESVSLSDAIWHSKWYEHNPRVRRNLMIMMMRMQKPLALSASPFYNMSNITFVAILRATFSCIAVFQKTYNRKH